jgi:hypothetical protein
MDAVEQLRAKLLRLKEADAAVRRARLLRAVDLRHGVLARPAPLDRECKDAVEKVEVVLDGL